jgi:hypothetical protein
MCTIRASLAAGSSPREAYELGVKYENKQILAQQMVALHTSAPTLTKMTLAAERTQE